MNEREIRALTYKEIVVQAKTDLGQFRAMHQEDIKRVDKIRNTVERGIKKLEIINEILQMESVKLFYVNEDDVRLVKTNIGAYFPFGEVRGIYIVGPRMVCAPDFQGQAVGYDDRGLPLYYEMTPERLKEQFQTKRESKLAIKFANTPINALLDRMRLN